MVRDPGCGRLVPRRQPQQVRVRHGLWWLVLGTASNVGRVFTHWWVFEALTLPLLITAIAVMLMEPRPTKTDPQ